MIALAPEGSQVSQENVDGLLIHLSVMIRSEATVIKTSDYSYADFAKHILR